MNKIIFMTLLLFSISLPCFSEIVKDDFADAYFKNIQTEKPKPHLNYNYENTAKVPIKLHITEAIKDENSVYEGQPVTFRVVSDVVYKGKIIIPQGTTVPARVETIISSGMNGIPASIIFGDFKFENIDSNKIDYTYERFGQDRSLWVYPLKWALTILPPTGSLTNFIKGGHAKLKTNKIIELNYYPEWI